MDTERVAPPSLNYDDVLPLAISSRSNRRTFSPVNGDTFSNANGSTIIRIDVNADSMLDATHSYLQVNLKNTDATANHFLFPDIGPAFIQRMRIESGGQTIEDINEYGKLYTFMMLHQCPEDYVKNVCGGYGLYPQNGVVNGKNAHADNRPTQKGLNADAHTTSAGPDGVNPLLDIKSAFAGVDNTSAQVGHHANNGLTAAAVLDAAQYGPLAINGSRTITIPLLSGFLNQDKLIPLIMMNSGFTIELHLAPNNAIGQTVSQQAGTHDYVAAITNSYELNSVRYVAHLIDLDRDFYGKLKSVMDESGGILQLAGQTYRHYSAQIPAAGSNLTVSLPARVKSIKSIFGIFCNSTHRNATDTYSNSLGQSQNIDQYHFEIGSVRYPQSAVNCGVNNRAELLAEVHKAFGKLGDYSHSSCVNPTNLDNPNSKVSSLATENRGSYFMIGYDFEAFQKVALESGINSADRSLPINFVCNKSATTTQATHSDFYVLSDAIYYVNSDGTVSVSI